VTAGDKGVTIAVDVSELGYVIPDGATCTLLAAPGYPFDGSVAAVLQPVTAAQNGLSAAYRTTGTDFPSGGNWNVQLQVTQSDSDVFTSPAGEFFINQRL
jgi:hypothetical protein